MTKLVFLIALTTVAGAVHWFSSSTFLDDPGTRLALGTMLNPQIWSSDPNTRRRQMVDVSPELREIEKEWEKIDQADKARSRAGAKR
jgi:hypothetical protein